MGPQSDFSPADAALSARATGCVEAMADDDRLLLPSISQSG
jgi:hypothetical protein